MCNVLSEWRTDPSCPWDAGAAMAAHADAPPPPRLVVVTGPEQLLISRAIRSVVDAVRAAEHAASVPEDQRAVVTRLGAEELAAAGIEELLSPSLFGERRVVVLTAVQDLPESLAQRVRDLLASVAEDATLVLVHKGVKNKKLMEAAIKLGAQQIACAQIKYDSDKIAFALRLAREAHRAMAPEAAAALVEAHGQDLAELAAGVEQLIAITTGTIAADTVTTYYGGRVESSGFKVADAAVAGDTGAALTLLRHGLALGLAPVLVTSALAGSLRTIARVASAPRGLRKEDLARDLGVAPFAVEKARRMLPGWTPEAISAAIRAVALADASVKGGGTDPAYALERVVVTISAARQPR